MKRITVFFLLAALLCGLLTGCTTEEPPYMPTGDALDDGSADTAPRQDEDQKLTLIYYPDRSLNPYTCMDYTNRVLFSLLYQGLFAIDPTQQAQPVLCERYTVSPDSKTYTFYLCKAWFADGSAVTAEDVVQSLNAAKKGYYASRFRHIKSIQSRDGAVVIQLSLAMENLPVLLDIPIVKAAETAAEAPMGTGPYQLEALAAGKQLRRQAAWWCKAACVATAPTIALEEATSVSQIRDSFEFGDLDLVCADPGNDTYVDYRCDYEIWGCDTGLMLYLVCHTDSWLFHDAGVRKAITHAIDRSVLVDDFYRGFATAATLPADPNSPYYNTTLAGRYDYDSAAFEAALANGEVPEEERAILAVNADDARRVRVAEWIAETLRGYGLQIKVEKVPQKDFATFLKEGKFDLYLGQTKLSPNMDLTAFFGEDGSLSYGDLADDTLYYMNQEALANSGNYYNLHEQVMENGHLIPLVFRGYAVYATRGVVTELDPARDSLFYYDTGRTLADAFATE